MSNDPKVIDLLPAAEGDGFRTKNSSPQSSRPFITGLNRSQALRFGASLVGVVHGRLSTGQRASLIVTEFRFASRDAAQRFKSATINYVFLPEDEASDEPGPEIDKIEPYGKWLMEHTEASTSMSGTSDDPSPSPGMLNRRESISSFATTRAARVDWKFERIVDHASATEEQATLMGILRSGNQFDDENMATWYLEENPSTKSGIPTVFKTAVLLKRASDANFVATLDVQAEVDFRYQISAAFNRLTMAGLRNNAFHFNMKESRGSIDVKDINALDQVELTGYTSTKPHRP